MAELGRSAGLDGADTGAASAIRTLLTGDAHARRLALQSAWGSRDAAVVKGGLGDPSRLIRAASLPLAAAVLDADDLLPVFAGMSRRTRRGLLVQLRKRRRPDVADRLLQSVQADQDFGPLLAYGSGSFVERHLPSAAEGAGLDWAALAEAHARVVADHLIRNAAGATEADRAFRLRVVWALPALGEQVPDRAVDLVRLLAPHGLARLPLAALAARRPDAVADLLLADNGGHSVSFGAVAHRMAPARLLAVLDRFGDIGGPSPARWIRRLPPGLRADVFAITGRAWRNADGAVSLPILRLLPAVLASGGSGPPPGLAGLRDPAAAIHALCRPAAMAGGARMAGTVPGRSGRRASGRCPASADPQHTVRAVRRSRLADPAAAAAT